MISSNTNDCQTRGEEFDFDHYLEHQNKIQDHFKDSINKHQLLKHKPKSVISKFSSNTIIQLKQSNHRQEKNGSRNKKSRVELILNTLINNTSNKIEKNPTRSHRLFKQSNTNILDRKQSQTFLLEQQTEIYSDEEEDQDDEEEEMIVYLDSKTRSKINHKVRFSNNIVRYLRGPFKTMVHQTMHAVDVLARGTYISDDALQAVGKGLEKQLNNTSPVPTFAQITKDWKMEGDNPDRGFSSPSIWMRNPQGQRILVKIHDHPLCAANEWLAYVLGRSLALPVNQVQIAIHQNNLVTLHTDVASENEKTLTFMDLPSPKRKLLLSDPIVERMDIFDKIMQNVDRNQQNVLITIPKTIDINDDIDKLKVHFIDHSNCFGMGKLNGISLVASKFHSNHLAVIKFDPIEKSNQFGEYLTKLPIEDHSLISKTLNRFSMISNEQFDNWMSEIQDLLSPSQYNRIHSVLYRQRDIAKRYTTQWGISSSVKSSETKQNILKIDDRITRF